MAPSASGSGGSGGGGSGSAGTAASNAGGGTGGTVGHDPGMGAMNGAGAGGSGEGAAGEGSGGADGNGGAGGDDDDQTSAGDAGTDAGGGDDDPVEEPPDVPEFTLVVDTPSSGDEVSGDVTVSGWAPGFLNVEVWDATHQSPPLAQVVPDADGSFELTVDASALAAGDVTWTVHAWDSPPGDSFEHHDDEVLQLQLESAESASGDSGLDPATLRVPAGYELVFNDEFDGSSLDTTKWNTLGPWGVQFFEDSHQKQAFVPSAVSLDDGRVTFTAQRSNGSGTNGQPYSSGSITTNGTFTHGYFEARVSVPSGKGYWPAFWVTSSTRWPPEWDIMEIVDGVIYGYPHPIDGGTCQFVEGAAGSDSTYTLANLYDTYHVYGFHWTASDLYWYVDNVMTEHWHVNAAAGANDAYWVNLSLQVGGDWPGDPDSSTPFPGRMHVDYVRIYQDS